MTSIKLIEGQKYRVKYARYRNPFAGVAGLAPDATMPVYLEEPGVFNGWRLDLKRGDILTYRGSKTGAGSDPGLDELFEDSMGRIGAFNPTRGPFGNIHAAFLQPVTDAIYWLEGNEYRLVTASEYDAAKDKPDGLDNRAAILRKDFTFVIYDPEGDENGFMLWGNDPVKMAEEAVEHLELTPPHFGTSEAPA